MKVVIVGGVAGGASAAARLRRLDESAQIIVFERSGYVSYANCGLPYYIGGVIENRDLLTLQTPKSFKSRFNIDVHVHHEVVAIHRDRKAVTVRNLETGAEFEETYDKLILSPWGEAYSSAHARAGVQASVYASHSGGYSADPRFCRERKAAARRAGGWWIHRARIGGKSLRNGR